MVLSSALGDVADVLDHAHFDFIKELERRLRLDISRHQSVHVDSLDLQAQLFEQRCEVKGLRLFFS